MAIGARSQAARTYLEKFLNELRVHSFPAAAVQTCVMIHLQECELEELVKHGLRALRDTLPNEVGIAGTSLF